MENQQSQLLLGQRSVQLGGGGEGQLQQRNSLERRATPASNYMARVGVHAAPNNQMMGGPQPIAAWQDGAGSPSSMLWLGSGKPAVGCVPGCVGHLGGPLRRNESLHLVLHAGGVNYPERLATNVQLL